MPRIEQEIMTLDEAASMLRLHEMTVYKRVRAGEIPARKIGGVWRFSREQLIQWIRQGGKA